MFKQPQPRCLEHVGCITFRQPEVTGNRPDKPAELINEPFPSPLVTFGGASYKRRDIHDATPIGESTYIGCSAHIGGTPYNGWAAGVRMSSWVYACFRPSQRTPPRPDAASRLGRRASNGRTGTQQCHPCLDERQQRGQSLQPPFSRIPTIDAAASATYGGGGSSTWRKSAPQHTTKTPTATRRLTSACWIFADHVPIRHCRALTDAGCDRKPGASGAARSADHDL